MTANQCSQRKSLDRKPNSKPNSKSKTMEMKGLFDIFDDLIASENRAKEKKTIINSLKTEIRKNEQTLREMKTSMKQIESQMCDQMATSVETTTELGFIDSENTILWQQIQCFETKLRQLTQTMVQMKANRKQEINEFVEKCFQFSREYGTNGCLRRQTIECEERVKQLIVLRDELQTKVNDIQTKAIELKSIMDLKQTLNEEMSRLNAKINVYSKENLDLKLFGNQLSNRLKELTQNECIDEEFVSLTKELQSIEVKPKSPEMDTRFTKAKQLVSEVKQEKCLQSFVHKSEPKIKSEEFITSDCETTQELHKSEKRVKTLWELKRHLRKTEFKTE
ncbi:unnamed protein product [Medioppia subpectinata]|uniref:Uncharacterized protein n=1 Tax=Medioppia subpectinata TaxID=1979941 RepID=A0A7R9PWI8_9ACAR|nr:unnamed protein product [Medioppia subpectinata]CAG2103386.1 unnamed protein product [Medioppia subpectinata]